MNAAPRALAGTAVLMTALAAGCTTSYDKTPVPSQTPADQATAARPEACSNMLASYDPAPLPPPGKMPAGSTMAKFTDRGRLVVGVSGDAVPMGARNPLNGEIEGFEIDVAKSLAKAMFGDETKLELRVIRPDQVAAAIGDGDLDLVIRQVGITCAGWRAYAVSAPYLATQTQALTKSNANIRSLGDLRGHSVCAARDSVALAAVSDEQVGTHVVGSPDTTQCMVKFQRGEVDAIAGDAVILAGLQRQDPFSVVAPFAMSTNSYGVAINSDRVDLVRFVNAVLAQRQSSGEWTASWNRWARSYAGDAKPPAPVYGRIR